MTANAETANRAGMPTPFYAHLYVQVLTAIAAGIALGHFAPATGEAMKPLGDGFIKLIKMIIAPIIFVTVVHGIASMRDLKKVGRVGVKALIYFEIVTTLALVIGLVVANVVQPGAGMNIDPATIDTKGIETFVAKSKDQSTIQFLLDIIPATLVGAFSDGNILQVLLIAILFSFAYAVLTFLNPAAISVNGHPIAEERVTNIEQHVTELMHFSIITLTTVGYGDIVPVAPMARSMVVLEALAGQLCLAAFVARLVGAMSKPDTHDVTTKRREEEQR